MKPQYSSFAKVFLSCLAGFVLARQVIFPGILDPTVPSHSDLYRYFLIGQANWQLHGWLAPRPLMLLFLHLIGGFIHTPEAFWFILSMSSIAFIAVLIEFLRKFWLPELSSISIFLYATVVFSLPSSWEIYQLDYGGMLSGILCIGSLWVFLSTQEREESGSIVWYVVSLLLYWVAIETKPTFAALMLTLALLNCLVKRSRISYAAVAGIVLVSVFVVVKDKLLGSPFLNHAGVYQVKLSLADNYSALVQYLRASIPKALIPGLFFTYVLALLDRKTRMLALLAPVFALSAIAPMVLIPNRVLTLYSWYPSIFFLLPLLMLKAPYQAGESRGRRYSTGLCLVIIVACQFIMVKEYRATSLWDVAISQYNANIIHSLELLRARSPDLNRDTILVSGLHGPYHAYRIGRFVRERTGLAAYTLLLRTSEKAWNDMDARNVGQTSYLNNVNFGRFDVFVVYNQTGRLKYILSRDELNKIPEWWRDAVVFCAANPRTADLQSTDFDKAVECFDEAGESAAAAKLQRAPHLQQMLGPKGLYHLGHSLIKLGKYDLARHYLNRSLHLQNNAWVRKALDSIKSKSITTTTNKNMREKTATAKNKNK